MGEIKKGAAIMTKREINKNELEHIKNYEIGVVKDRLIANASLLEELGYKRESRTLYRIIGELETWQNK